MYSKNIAPRSAQQNQRQPSCDFHPTRGVATAFTHPHGSPVLCTTAFPRSRLDPYMRRAGSTHAGRARSIAHPRRPLTQVAWRCAWDNDALSLFLSIMMDLQMVPSTMARSPVASRQKGRFAPISRFATMKGASRPSSLWETCAVPVGNIVLPSRRFPTG